MQLLTQKRVYISKNLVNKSAFGRYLLRFFLHVALILSSAGVFAQQSSTPLPETPQPAANILLAQASESSSSHLADDQAVDPTEHQTAPKTQQSLPDEPSQTPELPPAQPKRILGIMPNYRAVSAGTTPAPPSSKESFIIATRNSFDYSSFAFTGLTSLLAKGTDAHPDLGKGVPGLWAYTWRGFLDKTAGNYLVIWAIPTALHQDERYYAMGQGSKWKRFGYSLLQIPVARDYHGHRQINYSELLGRAGAQALSTTYYPEADSNWSDLSAKYAYALLRDGATNAFREFWPDIAIHVLHRQP